MTKREPRVGDVAFHINGPAAYIGRDSDDAEIWWAFPSRERVYVHRKAPCVNLIDLASTCPSGCHIVRCDECEPWDGGYVVRSSWDEEGDCPTDSCDHCESGYAVMGQDIPPEQWVLCSECKDLCPKCNGTGHMLVRGDAPESEASDD